MQFLQPANLSCFAYFCHVCYFGTFFNHIESILNNDRKMTKKYNASRKMSFLQPAKSSLFCHSCHLVDLFVFWSFVGAIVSEIWKISKISKTWQTKWQAKTEMTKKNDNTVTKTITDKTELTKKHDKEPPLEFPLKNGTTRVVAKNFFLLKLVVNPHGEPGLSIFCKGFLGQDFLERAFWEGIEKLIEFLQLVKLLLCAGHCLHHRWIKQSFGHIG